MNTWQIIWLSLGIVALFASIDYNVNYDHKIWVKQLNLPENYRPHKKGWRLKAFTSIPAVVFLILASNWILFVAIISSILIAMSLFLFFFDGWSANKKRKGWWYVGSTDARADPETDKFFRSMPVILHAAIKILAIIGSGWFYYIGLLK